MNPENTFRQGRPVMLYDGDCAFCQRWINKWRVLTGDRVTYETYQTAAARFPQVTEEACRDAVHLVLPDGRVFSGANAVFHALSLAGKCRGLLWCYQHVPFFSWFAERSYSHVARHRTLWSKLSSNHACCKRHP